MPRRIDSLTSIRAIAAAHVVVYHMWGRGQIVSHVPPLTNVLATGYLGVSLFFVLSGFVLTYTYLPFPSRELDAERFWKARVARVYPLYIFALAFSAPIFLSHFRIENCGRILVRSAAHLAMLQAWDYPAVGGWDFPSWSLSVEAFFYLVFPLLLTVISRKNTSSGVAIIGGLWIVELLLSATFSSSYCEFFPLLRLPEFLFGIAVALMVLNGRVQHGVAVQLCFIAAGIIVLAMLFKNEIPEKLLRGGFFAPMYALLILGLALSKRHFRFLESRVMVLLGEASYGIYLLHIPLNDWLMFAQSRLGFQFGKLAFVTLYITLLLMLSVMTYKFVEIPARSLILSRWSTHHSGSAEPCALKSQPGHSVVG